MRKMGFDDIEKNYHIKGDLAYTEDKILIYNIFAYNIPRKTTQEEALEYFSRFGNITSVRLVGDKRRTRKCAPKVCFIHYTDATSAASVLKDSTPHILKSKRICVTACHSWQQPYVSSVDDRESNADEESILQSKSVKLTMLNDDCLEHIFKKLGLKDQVRFALTCQRCKDIFEMLCKTDYKTSRVDDLAHLTLWEIREFLIIAGPHMETLFGSVPYKDRDRIVNFIGKFCPNIRNINLNSTMFKCSSFFILMGKIQHCTVLELRDCSLKDHSINALKKLPNLQSLSVADNFELTGKYMHRLTTLTNLVLYGCGNIQPSHFTEIIKSLTNLKSLDIQLCERLKSIPLNIMLNHSHKLESLKISCSAESYECIARLPSLKKLELLASTTTIALRQQLFEELVKYKANQLESLKIVAKNCVSIERARQIAQLTSLKQLICPNNENLTDECLRKFAHLKNLEEIVLKNCTSITNDGLLQLVRSCTKLKKVNIQLCTRITEQFVLDVIQVLKSTRNQRGKEPCLFYVARSGISTYITNHFEIIAAKGLLKISFYAPATLGIEGDVLLGDDSDDDLYGDNYYNDDNYDDDDDYDEYEDPFDMFDAFVDDFDDDEINDAYDMFGYAIDDGNIYI